MTTLVTGATGFLGGHLVRALSLRGEQVRALVRSPLDGAALQAVGVEVVLGDVTDQGDLVLAATGCERIFHLAGVVSHRRRDRELLQAVNVGGTRNVFEAAEPGTRIVHVSSVAAVGPVSSPGRLADERQPFPPAVARLPYAESKHAGEQEALAAAAAGADVVIANPGFLLGPGDLRRISTWPLDAYLQGKIRFLTRGGLSFADARDVADGLIALAEHGRAGERTILTGEHGNLSWRAFFQLVADLSGRRRRTVLLPAAPARTFAALAPPPLSTDDVRAACHWWFASPAKAVRELGFRTRPLAETVADTLADHAR